MTREEIEEWMREAAGVALKAALMCKAAGNTELSEHYGRVVEAFKTRADQVENMRCETCEYRPSLTCENERSVGFRNLVEYDNCCFHHKPRVTG